MDLLVDLAAVLGAAALLPAGLGVIALGPLSAYFDRCTCRRLPWENCDIHPGR